MQMTNMQMTNVLFPRKACVFCGCGEIDEVLTIRNMPISMGVTDEPAENDCVADQIWGQCSSCNALQLVKLVDINLLYRHNHSNPTGQLWSEHHQEFANFVTRFGVGESLLEIGGASGTLARLLLKASPELNYVMVEPDPARAPAQIRVISGFIEDHLEEVGEAGTIVHSHVLEHLYSPFQTLQKVVTRMRLGSRMIVSFPNLQAILEQGGSNGLNFEHTYFASQDSLEEMLRRSGLSILESVPFRRHSIFVACEKQTEGKASRDEAFSALGGSPLRYLNNAWETITSCASNFNLAMMESPGSKGFVFGGHVFAQGLIARGLNLDFVEGIIDNDPLKQGRRLYGTNKQVSSPSILSGLRSPVIAVLASHYQDEVTRQLRQLNSSAVIVEG